MCEPTTIIMAAGMIAGGIMQKRQADQQAKMQKHQGEYNARVAQNEATKTTNAGVIKENQHREKVQQMISQQRAQAGARGVQIDSGSALALQQNTKELGEVDALNIRANFADRSESLSNEAVNTRYLGDAKAASSKASGNAALVGSVFSAGGMVASKWKPKAKSPNAWAGANDHATVGGL